MQPSEVTGTHRGKILIRFADLEMEGFIGTPMHWLYDAEILDACWP